MVSIVIVADFGVDGVEVEVLRGVLMLPRFVIFTPLLGSGVLLRSMLMITRFVLRAGRSCFCVALAALAWTIRRVGFVLLLCGGGHCARLPAAAQ